MRYIVDIDIADNKKTFVEEFFKTISFVKKVRIIESNEITNPAILQSIEDYEKRNTKPTPLNLAELKDMINAWASLYAKSLARFGLVDEKRYEKCKENLQPFKNACKTPFVGLGQPEALKANYSGYWSRRINLEHRIVYKVEDTQIVVHSLYGHYQ